MENNVTKDDLTSLISYPYFEEVLKQEEVRSKKEGLPNDRPSF